MWGNCNLPYGRQRPPKAGGLPPTAINQASVTRDSLILPESLTGVKPAHRRFPHRRRVLAKERITASESNAHGIRRHSRNQHARNNRPLPADCYPPSRARSNRHRDRCMASQQGPSHNSAANAQRKPHRHLRHDAPETSAGCEVSSHHYVQPYRRANGTLVRGHTARNPGTRIGARGVLLVIALLVILGSLVHAHASDTGQPRSGGVTQHSLVTSAKTP